MSSVFFVSLTDLFNPSIMGTRYSPGSFLEMLLHLKNKWKTGTKQITNRTLTIIMVTESSNF